jgi:hypothetical protein
MDFRAGPDSGIFLYSYDGPPGADRQVVDRKMDGGLGNDGEAERSFLKFGNS